MEGDDLKNRTKQFPLRIIRLVKAMAQDLASRTIAAQTIRSSTSVSANYRAASIAKSPKNFINKLRITSQTRSRRTHSNLSLLYQKPLATTLKQLSILHSFIRPFSPPCH